MVQDLPKRPFINIIFGLFLQVIFIFVCLTIFFFTYVNTIEKGSFKVQMNLVVDDLSTDINVRDFILPGQEDVATVILDGSMEVARRNSLSNTKEDDANLNIQNTKIKNKAFMLVGIAGGIFGIIMIILLLTKHNIPVYIHTQEAIVTVFFVIITELFFLNIITKNYWSVDPVQVRLRIGESIQKWIQQNHPQK